MDLHGPRLAVAGRTASFMCTLTSGSRGSFSWFKEGRILKSESRFAILSAPTSSMLTISGLSQADSGSYTCLAGSDHSEDRASLSFAVQGKLCRGGDDGFVFLLPSSRAKSARCQCGCSPPGVEEARVRFC